MVERELPRPRVSRREQGPGAGAAPSGGARFGDTQPIPVVTLTHHTAEMPAVRDEPEEDPLSWHYSTYRPPDPDPEPEYDELGPWWTRIIATLSIAAPPIFAVTIVWSEWT